MGRHLLGPHVLGQRIVVRRLLRGETGPSGGPAMTDLLGVCTAWGEGRCVVRTDRGDVEVPLSDIVSGKPVPPRPSVRQRVSAGEAESHVLSLFTGLELHRLGDWTLRSDPAPVGRPRRRANSCLAMGDPGTTVEKAARTVREWYADRSRPPMVQVETGSAVEDALCALGWQPLGDGDAHFELASVSRLRRSLSPAGPDEVELQVDGDRATARIVAGDAVVASGRASYGRDWIGLHSLHVEPAQRRTGLARRLVAELLEWGAERGATTAWLHVETDNGPAQALYASLGFRTHHTCRYLRPA